MEKEERKQPSWKILRIFSIFKSALSAVLVSTVHKVTVLKSAF